MRNLLAQHLTDTLTLALCHKPSERALVIYDAQSPLAQILTQGYRDALPFAEFVDFDASSPEGVLHIINTLAEGDLVVLIQSTSFRLNAFRFRLELFNRKLKVIEHPHLARMHEEEFATFIDALAYDPSYYRTVGPNIAQRIKNAQEIVVESGDARLVYSGAFEEAKLNIGDYTHMKNVGGQFPIGEVFTEPKDFSHVHGEVYLYAFGGEDFRVTFPKDPVHVIIEKGKIADAPNAPESFLRILAQIRADEEVWVRELGFGLNRALTRTRTLSDIGSYERMCGVHLSLGQKHTIYIKPGMPKRSSKYHIDVFVDVTRVLIDGHVVYEHGSYEKSSTN